MFFLAAMFLANTCTCAVYGKRRPLQSAHVQVLAKNMAAKKNTLRFCSGTYVSVCKYSVAMVKKLTEVCCSFAVKTLGRGCCHYSIYLEFAIFGFSILWFFVLYVMHVQTMRFNIASD